MMRWLTKIFLKGLLTFLPLAFSIAVLVWSARELEGLTNKFLLWFLPDFLYIPGMGIVIGIILVMGLGLFMEIPLGRYVYKKLEVPFTSVPLVKSFYFAVKDLASFLVPTDGRHKKGQAVLVSVPGASAKFVGILTRGEMAGLPKEMRELDCVAVYLPMSYQIGGFSLFVPRSWIQPMNMPVEEAMRQVITAWMPTSSSSNQPGEAR